MEIQLIMRPNSSIIDLKSYLRTNGSHHAQDTMAELRENATDSWIPLMDYAIKKGVSLSTLRRHIKANKVIFKVENGRYLLWDSEMAGSMENADQSAILQKELHRLATDLLKAQEEIAELKTLIAFYEEKIPQRFNN